jgi:hypothetical protein
MYGGLFGDLPAAKGSDPNETKPSPLKDLATTKPNFPSVKRPSAVPAFVPPTKKKAGIVQAIGAAGTSMAFVPAAARRKNKSRFEPGPSTNPTAPRDKPKVSNLPSKMIQQQQQTTSIVASSWQPSVQMTTETTVTTVHHIHPQHAAIPSPNMKQYQNHEREEEEIKDVYDPYVPNDLLQYWDRQSLAKEREALERETKEALEKQRILRMQLEKERETLQQKGDYSKFLGGGPYPPSKTTVSTTTNPPGIGMGRGRGRGVSNLPAWLIEQKRKEQELGGAV